MNSHCQTGGGTGALPEFARHLWAAVLILVCTSVFTTRAAATPSGDRSADSSDTRQVLAQLPFAIVISDHLESIGTCERQAQVIGFESPLGLDEITERLSAGEAAAAGRRSLWGRQQNLVWTTWWQGNTLLSAVMRPLVSTNAASKTTGRSQGILIINRSAGSSPNAGSVPTPASARPMQAYPSAGVIAGYTKGLADDRLFLQLLANGRISCSREASQTHWSLVAHAAMPVEQMLIHFHHILLSQFGSVRRLDDGSGSRRALLLVSDWNRQLLFGLHGTTAGTGVVIHAVEHTAPVTAIGARSWSGQ